MFKWLSRLFGRKSKSHRVNPSLLNAELSSIVGYSFANPNLLVQALKHRSFLPEVNEMRVQSNERLELLGDSVLGLVVTESLYHRFPQKEEGEITMIKSLLVSRKVLSSCCRDMRLGEYILLSESEENSGGRDRPSILADTFEAIIGAIYLDGGLPAARKFVGDHLLQQMESTLNDEGHRNFKSILLEYAQSRNLGAPVYSIRSQEGPDHDKWFTIEVKIQNQIMGVGEGNSKKIAEQHAARNALEKLHSEEDNGRKA
jgi:ribonuclease-3